MANIFRGIGGNWGLLALALVLTPTGRKVARVAAREAVRAGIVASEKIKELADELKEEGSDMIAELRDERAQQITADDSRARTRARKAEAEIGV